MSNEHHLTNEYAVVLTSCGRFELLRRTVESFLRFADIRPAQFIVVEDSGDDKVREALAGLDYPFEFVINRPPLGQAAAIDVGYARVKTPFVFHCQDDWQFFRTGFIAESFILLQEFPKVSVVFLRGRDERKELRELSSEEIDSVMFVRTYPKLHKQFFGYGYNPGLRRIADYQRIAPIAKIGNEGLVSVVFKMLGYSSAHLEIPATVHLGWGRSALTPAKKTLGGRLRKRWVRLKNLIRIIKWHLFGLPKKWRKD